MKLSARWYLPSDADPPILQALDRLTLTGWERRATEANASASSEDSGSPKTKKSEKSESIPPSGISLPEGEEAPKEKPKGEKVPPAPIAQSVSESSEWRCGICTFVNDKSSRECEICGFLREVKPKKPSLPSPPTYPVPSVGASVKLSQWDCKACTFLNAESMTKCEMCETPR